MVAASPLSMSYGDYLAAEARAEGRHEFVAGHVVAMAGGSLEHARLAMAFGAALVAALAGRRCVVFNADARVRIALEDAATYPDLSVVCGALERAPDDPEAIANPVVIVEVLSDTTEAYDRGEKFRRYRRLPSLREYVLVSQRAGSVEVFRRRDDGQWLLAEAGPGARVQLTSLDVALDVDALYRDALAPPSGGLTG